MLKNIIKIIKLELVDNKEIIIEYEKPEKNRYVFSVTAHNLQTGSYVNQFLSEVPQKADTKVRVDSDEHFEDDIITLALNNVANGNIIWDEEIFED